MGIKKTQDFFLILNPLKKLQKVAFYDTRIKFLPKKLVCLYYILFANFNG
jgi:hypothetical protein